MSDSCDPMDCSLPGSSIPGISQVRILEYVAISFSRGSFWPRDKTQVSCIAGIFFTDWATREAHNVYAFIFSCLITSRGFPDNSVGKEHTCNAGDPGSISGVGRSAGEGIGYPLQLLGFPCGSAGKEFFCKMGDLGLTFGLGTAPGEGKGYPLQYCGLEKSMYCIVHGVAKTRTQLSDFHYQWQKDWC